MRGTYDNFNRLKLRDYSDATPDVSFFYDGRGLPSVPNFSKGKTTKVSSSVSESRYTSFDSQGRLLTSEQRTPFSDTETIATATPRVSSYNYDAFGKLLTETYPSGRTVKMDYNTDGDVSSVWGTVNGQNRLYANGFNYNSAGAIERLRLGNGKWETTAYNNRLQVTQIGLGSSATDKSLLKLEYDYGTNLQNNGSLRSQKINFSGLSQPFEQTYTYDDLNRLQSATEVITGQTTPTWKQTFLYDRYGNRRFDAANTTTLAQNNNITNPNINTSDNRFSAGQNYSYDKDGNLTNDANGNQFLYDAENHQKEVKNAQNQTIGLYLYDGEGKRVKKISSTETTIFVYDGGGQLTAEYSTNVTPPAEAKISYLTSDHLGSPRIITDGLGKVIARHDYAAFGDESFTVQRTQTVGYKPDNIRQDYTGYQKDDESGLEFAQARYYNTAHGRFTSVDPLTASANVKNPQTFNRYSYVLNSPYKFSDPLGLLPEGHRSSDGSCGAENSSCSDNYGSTFDDEIPESHSDEASASPVTDNTDSAPPAQEADTPALPPAPAAEQNANSSESNNTSFIKIEVKFNKTQYLPVEVSAKNEKEAEENVGKAITKVNPSCEGNGGDCAYLKGKITKTKSGFLIEYTPIIYLPTWKEYNKASDEEKNKWDRTVYDSVVQEQIHILIFKLIDGFLKNKIPSTVKTIPQLKANNNYKEAWQKVTVINDAWDETTGAFYKAWQGPPIHIKGKTQF